MIKRRIMHSIHRGGDAKYAGEGSLSAPFVPACAGVATVSQA